MRVQTFLIQKLCVFLRDIYHIPLDKKVKTQLLELIALDATNCSAIKIFENFKQLLEDKKFL